MCESAAPVQNRNWQLKSDAERVLDACQHAASLVDTGTLLYHLFAVANQCTKMSATLPMCLTMITQTTPRITSIVLAELDVPAKWEPQSPYSPLTVSPQIQDPL